MATSDTFRRGILPNLSDEDLNRMMWCCTPYPFTSDVRRIRRCLRRYLKLGGGTVAGAIDLAHRELDREWDAMQRQRQQAASARDPQPAPSSPPVSHMAEVARH